MFFHHKKNDFAVTLSNGRFIPPPEGWRGTIFYPLYDEDENEDDDDDDSYEEDDDYCSDDTSQYDDYKGNVGVKSAQKEDINQLYYDLLKNDNVDDGDNDDIYSDDEQ